MPNLRPRWMATSSTARRASSGASEWAWSISMVDMRHPGRMDRHCDAMPCRPSSRIATAMRVLLDCDRVNELSLRFPGPPAAEHPLGTGMHGIGRVGAHGALGLVEAQ